MKLTLAEALEVKRRVETRLLALPGVHTVDFGGKVTNGEPTGEFAICILVDKKRPREELSSEELIPEEIEGVKTDVSESDRDVRHGLQGGEKIYARHVSSGTETDVAGTLGCFAFTTDSTTPKAVLLSNDHVLYGGSPGGQDGDRVLVKSCSSCCETVVAKLLRTGGPTNQLIDAAIAELEPGQKWQAKLHDVAIVGTLDLRPDKISSLPGPVGTAAATRKLFVKKYGSETSLTKGVIAGIDASSGSLVHQLRVEPIGSDRFTKAGDSGSAVYVDNGMDNEASIVNLIFGSPPVKDPDKAKIVSLHWGGAENPNNSKGSHIEQVAFELKIKIATNSPEVIYQVEGEPIPHPALGRVFNDLSGTERVQEMLALYQTHSDEFTNLLKNSRQFVVAWHRNHGPQMIRAIIDVAQSRRPFLPEEIEGQSWADSIEQFEKVLLEVGSPELKADVKKVRSLATRLGGRSYEEILGFLVISDELTPTVTT